MVELLAGVDAAAVDGHAGALFGKALVGLGEAELGAHHVQQVFGIAAVVDGEVGRQADRLAVAAQQPGGDGVEGSAPDASRAAAGPRASRSAEHVFHPAEHLGRRAAGEGQQQDAPRVDAPGDQPGDAMDERGGLAGAGAGHDQQRPVVMRGRLRCCGFSSASSSSIATGRSWGLLLVLFGRLSPGTDVLG